MSNKTILERFRAEASTSTAEDHSERDITENTPMEIGEPDEPEPEPEPYRSRERFSKDELERLKKKYRMTNDHKQSRYDLQHQCRNCVKSFDDIVRKVHNELLAGRITMVGVTLTHKLPIKTRNRRVQTSSERVQPVQERMQSIQEGMQTNPEWMQPSPEWMQHSPQLIPPVSEHMYGIPEMLQHVTEPLQSTPERMQPMPEQMQSKSKRIKLMSKHMRSAPEQMQPMPDRWMQRVPERMRAVPKRMQPVAEPMQHVSKRMRHATTWMETRPERDNSLTRDFCGGTDPSILEGGCQCHKCLVEHNVRANARASRKKSRKHFSRIHLNRAHASCKDDALTELHHHILAGDKKTPGSMYVGILASLHDQGPCRVPCKVRADVEWMYDHIPKQAETQTDLTGNAGKRDQGSQTNLARSIGVQKGNALALMAVSRSSGCKSASTQLNFPGLSIKRRPVGRVLPTVIRNRS